MKKICSIVTALVMAFTIFIVPNLGTVYADDEDQPAVNSMEAVTPEETLDETTTGENTTGESTQEGEKPSGTENNLREGGLPDLPVVISDSDFSYTWISPQWKGVDDAETYAVQVDGITRDVENGKITRLYPGTKYTIKVTALDADNNPIAEGSVEWTTKSADVDAPGLSATAGNTWIKYSWDPVTGADGYAYARNSKAEAVSNNTDGFSTHRDNSLANVTSLSGTTLNWSGLTPRKTYSISICAYKVVSEDEIEGEEGNKTLIGTDIKVVKINGSGKYVIASTASVLSEQTTTKEKCVRSSKISMGYIYKYYDASGKYRGDSYGMWNAIKGKKSKTKYLIAIDRNRNNVVVYIKKNGVWTPYKHWLCACGMPSHKTPAGTHKIFKRKKKFNTGEKIEGGLKQTRFTCWYASRFKGACFIHSTIYMKGSMKKHAARKLGKNYSHGCVRLDIGNAKWVYKNCKNGTTVVVGDFKNDVSWGVLYDKSYATKGIK